MIYKCKNVLFELRKLTDNSEKQFGFVGGHDEISLADDWKTAYDYSKYKKEINGIIEQLVKDGYLNRDDCWYTLTNKGLNPALYTREQIKNFVLTSIFTPIVVSAITTLLVLSLESVFR